MAEFLTTHGTTARIEEVIARARERIVLISPYLRWSKILLERLVEADRRGVRVVFVYGKERLQPSQRVSLEQLQHLSLYYCANLHAKCYFNEDLLVLASLNLHEFSEKNNREMGIAFSRTDRVYRDAVREAHSIIEASQLERGDPVKLVPDASRPRTSRDERSRADSSKGTCIRCGKEIPLNRSAPYCRDCFSSWVQWENYDYVERKCHKCGNEANTTMSRPLCEPCFSSR
jgi:phosphatidylserine/phosphatidylglycerophosphate/cardiolipin synthase-like enzyme